MSDNISPSSANGAGVISNTATPVSGSSAPKISFDELFEMHGLEDTQGEEESVFDEDVKSAVTKAVEDKVLDGRTDPASGKEQNLLNEGAEKAKEEIAEEQEKVQKDVDAEARVLRARVGEEEITVPEDAVFTTMVNGREVEVQLPKAIQAFAEQEQFNRNATARIGKIKDLEGKFANEVQTVRTRLDQIADSAAQGDMMGAIKLISELSKRDVVEVEKEILGNMHRVFNAWTQMDEVQREKYFAERRAEYFKGKLEKQTQEQEYQKALEQTQAEVGGFCEKLGLSNDQFFGVFNVMAQNEVGPGKMFKSAEDIQPIDVAAYVAKATHELKVDEAIKQAAPRQKGDFAFRDHILEMTRQAPDFSVEDIADVIRIALNTPTPAVQTLSEKVLKTPGLKKQFAPRVSSTKGETDDSELVDFFLPSRR